MQKNVTSYEDLEKKFEAAGQPILSILENIHDGFLVMDHQCTIIYLNRVTATHLKIKREEVLGRNLWVVLPNAVNSEFQYQMYKAISLDKASCFESFYEPLQTYFEITVHPTKEMVVIYCKDITERRQSEKLIDHMNYYDMLTGLPNLKLFQDRLEQMMMYSKSHHESIAIMMIDLARLKSFKDPLGFQISDHLLKEIAAKLKELISNNGTVSRMNRDKFVCFFVHSERQRLFKILEKMLSLLSNPILIQGESRLLTPSIGVSMYPFNGETPQKLLSQAESAMTFVKNKGGNQYCFFKQEMERDIRKNYVLMAELSKATLNHEFQMFYQPLFDTKTGHISSVEALLRWKHPVYGYISPYDFIPLAEETGAIIGIGQWVLKEACNQIKDWHSQGIYSCSLSINFSARQLQQEGVVSAVKETILATGIEPHLLKIEVTESVMMVNVETTIDTLYDLKEIGVQIVIDDFGTYYSSLQYLKNFPLDIIKIDRCFIRDMVEHSKEREVVKMIIDLGHQLGMKVVAEGVENDDQYRMLKEYQCDEVQGYLFSKPIPAEEVNHFFI
ncbi:EAL domain-containing protein [Halalkalibacter sp. AB-rgal2]|uniref:EAL domain-containing protein n=1 Tax=Halalkalibacter sp. AB-rgal2 TaxID=3242695 RepID=UPI00359E792E